MNEPLPHEEAYHIHEDPTAIKARKHPFWYKIGGGALTFAILFHVVLLIIGAIWIFQVIREPEKKVDFLPGGSEGGGGERSAETKVKAKKMAQITPTTNVKRVFAEGAKSTYSIPDPGDTFGEMSPLSSLAGGGMSGGLGGAGDGQGFGKGKGNGLGGGGLGQGKLFGLIPDALRKRCSPEDRAQRLKENGGTPACEEAVVKGLKWLKTQQQSDGSWGANHKAAMTGITLLAYFGHCETPASPEFGESCLKGIVYLVDLGMKNEGKLAHNLTENSWVYEHAIATYALAEAVTFCRELKLNLPNLNEVTQKAGQFIIENQNKNGGWAYKYEISGGHTDVSVVGWQLQALKACDHSKLKFVSMTGCVNRGLAYLATCQNENGAFGYTGPPPSGNAHFPLTGVGMLCYQMWDKGKGVNISKAAKYTLETTTFDFQKGANLYAHYYESQAMMQRGGAEWAKYNQLFRDQLLKNQEAEGSWPVPPGAAHVDNKLFATTLCTLMLEVYYRFLSTGGGGGGGGGGAAGFSRDRPRL